MKVDLNTKRLQGTSAQCMNHIFSAANHLTQRLVDIASTNSISVVNILSVIIPKRSSGFHTASLLSKRSPLGLRVSFKGQRARPSRLLNMPGKDPSRDGKNGRSGGGRQESRNVIISKRLSFLLRHGAARNGVKMHRGGWANVSDVLEWRETRKMQVTFDEVKEVVETNEKKRFQIVPSTVIERETEESTPDEPAVTDFLTLDPEFPDEPSKHLIRATQGHSIKGVEASDLLQPITEADLPLKCPELVVHGTEPAAWELIQKTGGLKRMGRQYVHFAASATGGSEVVISGMRKNATIRIWVDVKESLAELEWWISANGVILTNGIDGLVPLKYVKRVERRVPGSDEPQIIWPDGHDCA